MKKLIIIIFIFSLCAMDKRPHRSISSSQRSEPIHSTLPQKTLRIIIEKTTGKNCSDFFAITCLPTYPVHTLFIFLKNNDYLLDHTPLELARKHLPDLRWHLFGQKTPDDMKRDPLILEETAQTILGIINSFNPLSQ